MTVAFLQNAYFKPGTDPVHVRRYMDDMRFRRKVLAMSRTGQRLVKAFGERYSDINWEEASPVVGDHPASVFPSDDDYIRSKLRHATSVVAFGKVASTALSRLWGGTLICAPHPTCRVVTNASLMDVASRVHAFDRDPVADQPVRQSMKLARGGWTWECVPPPPSDGMEYRRASGDVLCQACNKAYYDHPHDYRLLDHSTYTPIAWLHRICDGSLVKL